MQWSKYNTLFNTESHGYFLYNSLSNTFIQLDRDHYDLLENIQNNPTLHGLNIGNGLLDMLCSKRILVKKDEEQRILIERQYRRDAICFENTHLDLSICPTLSCNFRCPYCFENTQQDTVVMNTETVDRLIAFVKSYEHVRSVSITWYGGEPTINRAFDVVREITRRIKEVGIEFKEAGLVTNAYLLDKDKINQLNDLNIKTVQITIDGPQEVHDRRRILASGRPTFQRIMDNIETLMNSSFKGKCNIRVNLDKNNLSSFFELRQTLLNRFRGKELSVYAGHVDTTPDLYDKGCNLCSKEWKDFTLEQFRHRSVPPSEGIYPLGAVFSICSANTRNSYVIGPQGELYKCWEDVGRQEMIIGSIHDDDPITNRELVALYSVGTDPYRDAECLECAVLPICGGGCANRRLRVKHFNEKGLEYCSLYKENLIAYLIEYYEAFLTTEICAQVRNKQTKLSEEGYKIIR